MLFLTLPDARHTFDAPRARTTIEHVLADHRDGGQASRHEHFVECARLIEGAPEELAEQRAREMQADGWRIHFHVWELETFLALVLALELPVDIECAQAVADEFTLILRRRAVRAGCKTGARPQRSARRVRAAAAAGCSSDPLPSAGCAPAPSEHAMMTSRLAATERASAPRS